MSKNNYKNYYKEDKKNEIIDKPIVDEEVKDDVTVDEEVKDDVTVDEEVKDDVTVDEEVKDDVTVDEEVKDESITKGIVVNCERLNVRKSGNKRSEVLTVIDKGTEVNIKEIKTNSNFYKVEVNDVIGYCMKDYIEIK